MNVHRLSAPLLVTRSSLERFLLGSQQRQRLRASQSLLAFIIFCIFALLQEAAVSWGMVPAEPAYWLNLFDIGCSLTFFLVIRVGLNEQLSPRDPSLTLPQCVFAVTAAVWGYGIDGPVRGPLLALLILIIQFGGLFRLDQRQTRGLTFYAFLLVATAMVWRTFFAEERYDGKTELIHFAMTVIVLLGANAIAARYGVMRERMSRQKADLSAALELNRELATRDMLTGLLNRRAMVEMLSRPPARVQRGDGLMAVAVIDIDLFKRINDSCGHSIGDSVLHRFATSLAGAARRGDLISRWGGEEFLILMPGTSPEEGLRALDRLRKQIVDTDWRDLVGHLPVTFSAGVAGMHQGEDHEAAIERADQALYRAKHRGRNRIELAPT